MASIKRSFSERRRARFRQAFERMAKHFRSADGAIGEILASWGAQDGEALRAASSRARRHLRLLLTSVPRLGYRAR